MTSRPSLLEPASAAGASTELLPPSQRAPSLPVAVGDVVDGKYRIDRVIGFGGMGVVCAATHLELHTSLAVKFVRAERGVDERAIARFLTEARAAAQLSSPHVCRVTDCGRLPSGTPYLVMERLVGSDLHGVLAGRGPLPITEAVDYAQQACAALAQAHAKGIVHRDIKPENLFVAEGPAGAPCLKVLDFGISKQARLLAADSAITDPTQNMGSPFYMSPEQMTDPAGVDSRTDIWSLGVVLYELITGQLPFSGETAPQLCANVMTVRPIPPEQHRAEIPRGLARVVLRCLEKNREQRFRDVLELAAALRPFEVEPEPPVESVGEVSSRVPGLPRRGSGLRLSVGVVVLGASALATFALVRGQRHDEIVPPPPTVTLVRASRPVEPSVAPSDSGKTDDERPLSKARRPRSPRSVASAVSGAVPRPEPSAAPPAAVVYPSVPRAPDLPPP